MFEPAGPAAFIRFRNMSIPHLVCCLIVIIAGGVTHEYETPARRFAHNDETGRVWTVVPSRASGEIGRRARFRFWCLRTWGFKSPLAHKTPANPLGLRAVCSSGLEPAEMTWHYALRTAEISGRSATETPRPPPRIDESASTHASIAHPTTRHPTGHFPARLVPLRTGLADRDQQESLRQSALVRVNVCVVLPKRRCFDE